MDSRQSLRPLHSVHSDRGKYPRDRFATGGTVLHTSRTKPAQKWSNPSCPRSSPARPRQKNFLSTASTTTSLPSYSIISNASASGCLITIGGDEHAQFLRRALRPPGMPVIAISQDHGQRTSRAPNTCIGFSTRHHSRQGNSSPASAPRSALTKRIGVFPHFRFAMAGFTALYHRLCHFPRAASFPNIPLISIASPKLLSDDQAQQSQPLRSRCRFRRRRMERKAASREYGGSRTRTVTARKVDIGQALGERKFASGTGDEIMVQRFNVRSPQRRARRDRSTCRHHLCQHLPSICFRDGLSPAAWLACKNGCYGPRSTSPASSMGARAKWILAALYNTERYRPHYSSKLGAPLLFNRI